MKKIELLAPAKDLDCGLAAINCGADAVYIGAGKFGARSKVGNSLEDIESLCKHAHKFWARVYVTINTILFDEEMDQALTLIHQLYAIGVDGIIIQDMGLLELELPPVPLIASTQTNNASIEQVSFLENVGFKRVILARELDLDSIKNISANSSVELEYFVHGALCVSYSGQCYMSYAQGGRSGNRGECAQPCRKSYTLTDRDGNVLVKDRHLLSLRDLNLSAHLGELIDAGISSFKIEGRLKDKNYVSNVVRYYRGKLDSILEEKNLAKSSSGKVIVDWQADVSKTFNRGYTNYFVKGRRQSPANIDTPKMVGERLGKVSDCSGNYFRLDVNAKLQNGDGICFFDDRNELQGTLINQTDNDKVFPQKMTHIRAGRIIYRNYDHDFHSRLKKIKPERKIGLDLVLDENDSGFLLQATDENGIRVSLDWPDPKTIAEQPQKARAVLKKQLTKMGGSFYYCRNLQVNTDRPYFIMVSQINKMRRSILEAMTVERQNRRPVDRRITSKNDKPYFDKKLTYRANIANRKSIDFYTRHGVEEMEKAAETGRDMLGNMVMKTRYCVKDLLGTCPMDDSRQKSADPLFLSDSEGNRFRLRFNCSACEMEIWLEESARKRAGERAK